MAARIVLEPGQRRGLVWRLGVAVVVLALAATTVSGQHFVTGEVGLIEAANAIPTWLGWPLRAVMQLGSFSGALVVVGLVAWRTFRPDPRPTTAVAVAALVAFRIDNVFKDIIERPRPPGLVQGLVVREHIGGFGFPSGHTTTAFALAASLHLVLPGRWRWLAWALAAMVGLARMYVGVHWPLDVLGGAALGTAVASLTWLAFERLGRR